eukprot:403351003
MTGDGPKGLFRANKTKYEDNDQQTQQTEKLRDTFLEPIEESYTIVKPAVQFETHIKQTQKVEEVIKPEEEFNQELKKDVEQKKDVPTLKYYKVQKGDTLFKLSYWFNQSIPKLKDLNNLYMDDIFPDQVLKIYDVGTASSEKLVDDPSGVKSEKGGFEDLLTQVNLLSPQSALSANLGPLSNRAQTQYIDQSHSHKDLSMDLDEYFNIRSISQRTGGTLVLNSEDISTSFQKLQLGYQQMQDSFKEKKLQDSQSDVLKMFCQLTSNADKQREVSEFDKIQLSYYIDHKPNKILTDAYYCTKNGKVKGIMTLTEHLILFNPIKCNENEPFFKNLQQYQAIIDLQDIVSAQKIRQENDTSKFITDIEIKKHYKYDYYIQLDISCVDGKTLKKLITRDKSPEKKIRKISGENASKLLIKGSSQSQLQEEDAKSTSDKDSSSNGGQQVQDEDGHALKSYHKKNVKAKASVFFRYSHRDRQGQSLTNKQQKTIVEDIYDNMVKYIDEAKDQERDVSSTYVMYYDEIKDHVHSESNPLKIMDQNPSKQAIIEAQAVVSKKEASNLAHLAISTCIPDFMPLMKDKSEILTEANRRLITYFLPGLVRMREWKLLYSINTDGVSMQTFFRSTRRRDNTVLLIKDTNDSIFGAYCCEEWRTHPYYYGIGESFVFKFQDGQEDIKVFGYTCLNEKIQFCDDKCIMIGGGGKGASIFINNNFLEGRSSESETFNNEILSSTQDFSIKAFEVWGFDFV